MPKTATNTNPKLQFSAHQIYMKDMSVTSPLMPQAFGLQWKPIINFNIDVNFKEVKPSLYEVLVDYKLNIELDENNKKINACTIHIQQAGVFGVKDATEDEKENLLLVKAPELLYPFIRENVSSTINRLGFPQIILPLVNFEPE